MSDSNKHQKSKFLSFVNKNKKVLIAILAAIFLSIAGYFLYIEFYFKPKVAKAIDDSFRPQQNFNLDSSRLVLNGNGTEKGMLYVIEHYKGTKQANLAKFYAGVSYYKLGEYDNAIKYLKDFTTEGKQIQARAYGTLADAYADTKKFTEALEFYKKAGTFYPEDEITSSIYLFRAAQLQEVLGKVDDAIATYKDIKLKYPKTEFGATADKYINKLKVQP
jgi:tetratricopeptide (TPR) repeat protein